VIGRELKSGFFGYEEPPIYLFADCDRLEVTLLPVIFEKNKFGWNANDITVDKNFIPSKKWIKNKISKKKNMNFNPNSDFLIIP
jgi:hypothetical protein